MLSTAEYATVRATVARHAVNNTVVCTFSNSKALRFAINWARRLHTLGVRGLLVGLLGMRAGTHAFEASLRAVRPFGVAGFSAISDAAMISAQGGRWFHVLPLLMTGARVILSDCDVVFMRHPLPYFCRLEAAHPQLDLAVSSDAQGPTDAARLRGGERVTDLDLETSSACHSSMNIGLIHFPPGRPGAVRAVREAMAHLLLPGNLRRVDQGPINYRWKRGKLAARAIAATRDRSAAKARHGSGS